MKRKEPITPSSDENEIPLDVQESKKAKFETSSTTIINSSSTIISNSINGNNLFSIISNDELLCILYFLESESILSLYSTCKSVQQMIKYNVFEYLCKYSIPDSDEKHQLDVANSSSSSKFDGMSAIQLLEYDKKKLREVLINRDGFKVEKSNLEYVFEIIEDICDRNGSMSEFTNHLQTHVAAPQEIFELLDHRLMKQSVRKENSNEETLGDVIIEERIVNTVVIEALLFDFDQHDEEEPWLREPFENNPVGYQLVNIIGIPIGYSLKALTIGNANFNELFLILSKCYHLESLIITGYRSSRFRRVSMLDEEDEEPKVSEEYEENCFFIPILKSMKKFELKYSQDLPREKTLIDILKCCPNLETLYYCSYERLDYYILQKIPKYCTNLSKVTLVADSGSTPLENFLTDSQVFTFMKSQPNLKYFRITPCCKIDGSIYANIGECHKLEYLEIDANSNNADRVPQIEDIVFGGGSLPNLTHLNVGRLNIDEEKLETFAPNLISIEGGDW